MVRVTQSMLSNNMLRNLNNSYSKMSNLQDQLTTGKKFTSPSENPAGTLKSMNYRTELNKVSQYDTNITEANAWLNMSDDTLGQMNDAIIRTQELVTQAANDTNTPEDREKILQEITQIKGQVLDLANTKFGDKYIFSGSKTQTPLYVNGVMDTGAANGTTSGFSREIKVEVFTGVQLPVNVDAIQMFKDIQTTFENIEKELSVTGSGDTDDTDDGVKLSSLISDVQSLQKTVLSKQAEVGAKLNRVEMMRNRLSSHEVNVTSQLSDVEDVEYEEAITQFTTYDSIHTAALSVGSKIIQQTLVDFIR